MKKLFNDIHVQAVMMDLRVGLEKESQRIHCDGTLSRLPHPDGLPDRKQQTSIQTDFSETQVEMITPVRETHQEALDYLAALHEVVLRTMPEDEYLWPLSMPPTLPEASEILIAKLSDEKEVSYREHLATTYGKSRQMVSGLHYNFEFGASLIQALFNAQDQEEEVTQFQNELYLKVARAYLRYRWLVTYLFGASPIAEAGYFARPDQAPQGAIRSIRNSSFGYTNVANLSVPYTSLHDYTQAIERFVAEGQLLAEKEYYAPVRLRGAKTMSALRETGIRYLEIRNFDLNPFAPYGMSESQLTWMHLFLLTLLWMDEQDYDRARGDQYNEWVATSAPDEALSDTLYKEGQMIFDEMQEMIHTCHLPQQMQAVYDRYRAYLDDPNLTLSAQLYLATEKGQNQHDFALQLAQDYAFLAREKPYQLAGFRDMELSTQILLFEALKHGVDFEILDRSEQFVMLYHEDHIEYVKNANMTRKDTYISPLIMENKEVTKLILDQKGYRVPRGVACSSVEEACRYYPKFASVPMVVKPKSTNYGLGISIFKEPTDFESFQQAVQFAFEEDQTILIEEFMPGTEFRFVVIDGTLMGVLKRVPAHVVGDGVSSIQELVAQKNDHPYRGTDHRAPLEKIQLGPIEQLMLKSQGYVSQDIPKQGVTVYLRENSNISTGGDSIDCTDEVHESYHQVAIDAVAALGATICGIDLILTAPQEPVTEDNYAIIEANFNPAMHMHVYPYQGTSRNVPRAVLYLLFPEVKPTVKTR